MSEFENGRMDGYSAEQLRRMEREPNLEAFECPECGGKWAPWQDECPECGCPADPNARERENTKIDR